MYHPTTRVLTVLELLQAYGSLSGKELADRLEVDRRTVRRYIVMLQDMGVPVESERGRTGYYTLAKGFRLPPMMFTSPEALALALGLQVIRHIGMSDTPAAVEGAWAKLNRVLPTDIGVQLDGLLQSVVLELGIEKPPSAHEGLLGLFSTAIQRYQAVNMRYEAFSGDISQRMFHPYRVVYRSSRWYVVGYCTLREEIRVFRLDRIRHAEITNDLFTPPPDDFDAMAHVETGLIRTPGLYQIQVEFFGLHEDIICIVPKVLGELTPTHNGTMLTCYVQKLGWFAGFISGLGIPFQIHQPPELVDEMRAMILRAENAMVIPKIST